MVTALASTSAAAVLAGCSGASEPATTAGARLQVGVSLPSYHYDPVAVDTWERRVGHRADVVQTFVPWLYGDQPTLTRFPTSRARQISTGGRTLEVTWTPADGSSGSSRALSLASIADGDSDDYARQFADDVRDSGLHIRLRFAHEMNGSWSAWSDQHDGDAPGDYVRAWRHLHDLFAEQGATRVTWVWSPNVVGSRTEALAQLYPGDAYVDLAGIDGYSYPRTGCPSPSRLFGTTLRQVRAVSSRPVALAEVGVDRSCTRRAQWVTALFIWARTHHLAGVTWWERTGDGRDYRLVGDPAALAAYRRALSA